MILDRLTRLCSEQTSVTTQNISRLTSWREKQDYLYLKKNLNYTCNLHLG